MDNLNKNLKNMNIPLVKVTVGQKRTYSNFKNCHNSQNKNQKKLFCIDLKECKQFQMDNSSVDFVKNPHDNDLNKRVTQSNRSETKDKSNHLYSRNQLDQNINDNDDYSDSDDDIPETILPDYNNNSKYIDDVFDDQDLNQDQFCENDDHINHLDKNPPNLSNIGEQMVNKLMNDPLISDKKHPNVSQSDPTKNSSYSSSNNTNSVDNRKSIHKIIQSSSILTHLKNKHFQDVNLSC